MKNNETSYSLQSALIQAYNNHSDILLRPDDVWITICQGLSLHINKYGEELRKKFVDHEGQKDLVVGGANDFKYADWLQIFSDFEKLLMENVKGGFAEKISCNFSTTTSFESTVSRISLMCSMKKYFRYMVGTCGIRNVYFTGSLNDWELIKEKVEFIKNYDLEWWCDKLIIIINQFIESYKGNVNVDFWNRIIDMQDGTGASGMRTKNSDISGWILYFYPYDKYGDQIGFKIKPKNRPHMTFEVPLKYKTSFNSYDLKILAGFSGINYQDGIYKPQMSYAIVDNSEKKDKKKDKKGKADYYLKCCLII